MNPITLPRRAICVLDDDAGTRKRLVKDLKAIDKTISIFGFGTVKEAQNAFDRPSSKLKFEPAVVVTDSIGTTPVGESVADHLRLRFPLTRIILHSRKVGPNEASTLRRKHGIIDAYVSKVEDADGEELRREVGILYDAYSQRSPFASMRSYIERCPDPEAPFLNDGHGGFRSIIDLYWEAIRNTELGKSVARAWEGMIVEWLEPGETMWGTKHEKKGRRRQRNFA